MPTANWATLADYFADANGKQIIEIEANTIKAVDAAFGTPSDLAGYQVLYSIYMKDGTDDYSSSGIEFSLDFSASSTMDSA